MIFWLIFMISDPHIFKLSTFDESGPLHSIEVNNGTLFASTGSGICIYDISDESTPSLITKLDLENTAYKSVYKDDYLYVGRTSALDVIDVTSPESPVLIETKTLNGFSEMYLLDDQLIFVGANNEIWLFDISMTGNLLEIGSLSIAHNHISTIFLRGLSRYIIEIDQDSPSYKIQDITDLNTPILVEELPLPSAYENSSDLNVVGNFAYLSANDKVVIMDITDLQNPIIDGEFNLGSTQYRNLSLGTGQLLTWNSMTGTILDISDLANITSLGEVTSCSSFSDITFAGTFLMTAEGVCGFRIVNISNPESPNLISHVEEFSSPQNVAVSGNTVFAGGPGTLYSVDFSDLENPHKLDRVQDPLFSSQFIEKNGFIYSLVRFGNQIRIYDVQDPSNILVETPFEIPNFSFLHNNIITDNSNFAFVGDYGFGEIVALDLGSPGAPTIASRFTQIEGSINGLFLDGTNLYACGSGYIDIFNVSNPVNPIHQTTYINSLGNFSLSKSGNLAFLSAGSRKQILDTSDINNIQVLEDSFFRPQVYAEFKENFIFTPQYGGVEIYDLSEPSDPQLFSTISQGNTRKITFDHDFLFVPQGSSGSIDLFNVNFDYGPMMQNWPSPNSTVQDLTNLLNTIFRL